MTKLAGVLFDKDGTLFDFDAMWVGAYRRAAAEIEALSARPGLGQRLLEETGWSAGKVQPGSLLAAGSNGELAAVWAASAGLDPAPVLDLLTGIFVATSGQAPTPLADLDGLFAALADRGLGVGVATMDGEAGARAGLAAVGLSVPFVVGFDSGHGEKPHPGMVLAFAAHLGVPTGALVVVGDSPHDLHMARAAGAGLAVGVTSGTSPGAVLAPLADHILASVAQLPALLDARASEGG